MKKLPCRVKGCKGNGGGGWRDPDGRWAPRYVEVPDDWPDDRPVFCSMTCAILGGYMTLEYISEDDPRACPLCLAAGEKVRHHSDYKCWRMQDR